MRSSSRDATLSRAVPQTKNTEPDLLVSLKLQTRGRRLCVGFGGGSRGLCCGRRRAPSPTAGLKIARPLDVRLALTVSLGSLRSEHIAHNPLHMHGYIV